MDDSEATQLLKDERTRIEAALAELDASDRRDGDDQDHGDAQDLEQTGRDAGLRDQLEEELRAVERAEARLADGTYGISVESGEPIPDGRLRAQPAAERTVAEQQRLGA